MSEGFGWILVAIGMYGGLHSLLAGQAAKDLAARWLGQARRRWYRFFFSLVGGVTFLPVLALVVWLGDRPIYRMASPWSLIAQAGQGLAVLGLLVGVLQTGALAFIGLRPEPDPPRLVTWGLYRLVRHPLYTAGLVLLWLNPVMTWNFLALNLGVTFYLLVGIQFEERKLRRRFGQAYSDYARRTPMLIPGIRI